MVGLLLFGAVLGGLATWGYQIASRASSAGDEVATAPSDDREKGPAATKRSVFALGTIEPRDGSILVSSRLTGYLIQKVHVRETEAVEQGAVLIEIDPSLAQEELRIAQAQRAEAAQRQQTEIDLADQRLTLADLAVRQAEEAKNAEIEEQQKQIDIAELKVKQAQEEYQRLQRALGAAGAANPQLEQQKTVFDLTAAQRDAAKTALRRLEQTLNFNSQKALAEQRSSSQALAVARRSTALEPLDRQIAVAQRKLSETKIVAPSDGTVISILAHSGELVGTQPLLQLANLKALVCLAEVDVADLPLLGEHREAMIGCRAFHGAKVKGTIQRIRNMAGAATLRPADPRKPVDRSVATVVLAMDADEALQVLGGQASSNGVALIGLQVEVEFPL